MKSISGVSGEVLLLDEDQLDENNAVRMLMGLTSRSCLGGLMLKIKLNSPAKEKGHTCWIPSVYHMKFMGLK